MSATSDLATARRTLVAQEKISKGNVKVALGLEGFNTFKQDLHTPPFTRFADIGPALTDIA